MSDDHFIRPDNDPEPSDLVEVSREDVQAAINLLGGFMGSQGGYRRAEALRERLRAVLQRGVE